MSSNAVPLNPLSAFFTSALTPVVSNPDRASDPTLHKTILVGAAVIAGFVATLTLGHFAIAYWATHTVTSCFLWGATVNTFLGHIVLLVRNQLALERKDHHIGVSFELARRLAWSWLQVTTLGVYGVWQDTEACLREVKAVDKDPKRAAPLLALTANVTVFDEVMGSLVEEVCKRIREGGDTNGKEIAEFLDLGIDAINPSAFVSTATTHTKPAILAFLLERGAKASPTALVTLCKDGTQSQVEMARILMQHGAEISAVDSEGYTALGRALSNPALMDYLIEQGADINAPQRRGGKTMLMLSLESRDVAAATHLLGKPGLNLAAKDEEGRTALYYAIHNSDLMDCLIEQGADINAPQGRGGKTVLMLSLDGRDVAAATHLLGKPGLNLAAKDDEGRTALYYAIHNSALTDYLIEQGADINAPQGRGGKTVLMLTLEGRNVAAATHLLGKPGLNLAAKDEEGRTALHYAIYNSDLVAPQLLAALLEKSAAEAGVPDRGGNTPLHFVRSKKEAELLIRAGRCDLEAKNRAGKTALECAATELAASTDFEMKLSLIEFLFSQGARSEKLPVLLSGVFYNRLLLPESLDGGRFIKVSTELYKETVSRFQRLGFDINAPCVGLWTPLTCLFNQEFRYSTSILKMVLSLVECGADPTFPGGDLSETPLMLAVTRNQDSIVRYLLSLREVVAAINGVNSQGRSVLFYAANPLQSTNSRLTNSRLIKELILRGATVDLEDKEGNTPLIYSVKCVAESRRYTPSQHLMEQSIALVKAGASLTHANKQWETALSIAGRNGEFFVHLLTEATTS